MAGLESAIDLHRAAARAAPDASLAQLVALSHPAGVALDEVLGRGVVARVGLGSIVGPGTWPAV
jgi:hypothetical protein